MKSILLLVLLSFSFTGIAQNNQLLIESHTEKLKNAKTYALSMAGRLNEERYDFRPVEVEMSFKEQLVHVGENIYWLSSIYLKEAPNPSTNKKMIPGEMTKTEVLQFLSDAYDYGIKTAGELDEKLLSKQFDWNGGKLNKYQFLNLIQDHQSHHIGQLVVYLRLNAVEPPKYIGW